MPKIKIPSKLCCPITHDIFKDPVFAKDGHTYERPAISKWLATNKTSPITKILISNKLTTNFDKIRQLDSFFQKNNICTPEHFINTIESGNVKEIVKLNYLESYLEHTNSNGWAPLRIAVLNKHIEMVKWLLDEGANPNSKIINHPDYGTPLHLAVINDNKEIVEILLGGKANLETTDNEGNTPLHWAVATSPSMILLLLNHGANPEAINNQGMTPAQRAKQKSFGRIELAELIIEYTQTKKVKANKSPQEIIISQSQEIAELKKVIQQQQQRIDQLTEQLNKAKLLARRIAEDNKQAESEETNTNYSPCYFK